MGENPLNYRSIVSRNRDNNHEDDSDNHNNGMEEKKKVLHFILQGFFITDFSLYLFKTMIA